MGTDKFDLKGGVIVIGSLLWQDHLNEKGDNIRLNWRENNLDMDNIIPVKLPIRYGRVSQSNIATTVFSNEMKNNLGCGYVIPFKETIENEDELRKQVVALSAAEGLKGNMVRKWGVLSYYFTDEDKHVENDVVIKYFKKNKNMDFNYQDFKIGNEKIVVYPSLKLNIDSIVTVNENDESKLYNLDFLLATVTKPNIKINETKRLASLVKGDTKRQYYINNISNGIITGEDFEISKLL